LLGEVESELGEFDRNRGRQRGALDFGERGKIGVVEAAASSRELTFSPR